MRRLGAILAVAALCVVLPADLRAEESLKDSFKKMGKAVGQAGKAVGKEAAQAGRTIGRESKKVWYRGVQVSNPALERARTETRQAMQKTLNAMDRTIDSLQQELRRLREAEAAGGG